MIICGEVFKYGNDINTDVIFPARYMSLSKSEDMALHCMEDIDKDFADSHKAGDVIVAGENFGCGSSREHAPLSIKASGISCVIAKSFARIFYRNAINIGLPIIECPEAVEEIEKGQMVEVELESGKIYNVSTGHTFKGQSFPLFIREIIEAGGLLNTLK